MFVRVEKIRGVSWARTYVDGGQGGVHPVRELLELVRGNELGHVRGEQDPVDAVDGNLDLPPLAAIASLGQLVQIGGDDGSAAIGLI